MEIYIDGYDGPCYIETKEEEFYSLSHYLEFIKPEDDEPVKKIYIYLDNMGISQEEHDYNMKLLHEAAKAKTLNEE